MQYHYALLMAVFRHKERLLDFGGRYLFDAYRYILIVFYWSRFSTSRRYLHFGVLYIDFKFHALADFNVAI